MSSRVFCGTSFGTLIRVLPSETDRPDWVMRSVESHGRSLEELEWVYLQPNPVKASLRVDKVVIQADGHVVEKVVA